MKLKKIILSSLLCALLLAPAAALAEDLSHEPLTLPPPGIVWKDQQQKEFCEEQIELLLDHFRSARFYSIQGDSCRTALYAKRFMEIVAACRQECPEELLEKKGFHEGIIRNLRTLEELGTRRCEDGK